MSTARRTRRQLAFAAVLADSVLPAMVLETYFLADLHLPVPVLLGDLAAMLLVAPLLAIAVEALAARWQWPLWAAVAAIEAGQSVAPSDLDRARRLVFRTPWLAAAITILIWTLALPPMLATISFLGHHHAPLEYFMMDGLVLAPLAAMAVLFATELVLRPAVAVLFRDGGVARFRTRFTLSIRLRAFLTTFFIGPYSVGLLAFLVYRRVSVSHDLTIALHRLVPLEAYMVLVTGLLVGLLLAFAQLGTGKPIERLEAAMGRVQEGDLEARVPVDANDQIGAIADRFNAMATALRDRERMREAFGRFVSPEVANKATTGELTMGGETRDITVLFSDVRNFTAMSETMAPDQVVELMNRYFEAMVPCITEQRGYMNKFIGDGIMAIFGAPVGIQDHASAALRAALAMREALARFNAAQRERDLPELAIGVGIATGPVVVGIVGSHKRQEYTAIGDTVNTASRIEGLNKEFGTTILLEETAARQAGLGMLREVGPAAVKGKAHPLIVYTVQAEAERTIPGVATAPGGPPRSTMGTCGS